MTRSTRFCSYHILFTFASEYSLCGVLAFHFVANVSMPSREMNGNSVSSEMHAEVQRRLVESGEWDRYVHHSCRIIGRFISCVAYVGYTVFFNQS